MHVAVTGASSGIGEAIAREFGRAGARLTLVARRRDLLDRLAAEIRGGTHAIAHDLADSARACDWIREAESVHGPIEVLVNNAGVELNGFTPEIPVAEGVRLLRLNLETPLRLTRAVLPGMIARGRGTIVDVASVAALVPPRGLVWYAASKAGLAAHSEGLRGELHGTGVHVVTVYPGPVHSEMGHRSAASYEESIWMRLAPWGTSDVLARLVRGAVEKRKHRVIYPRFYAVTRWFPPLARWATDLTTPDPKKLSPVALPVTR